MSEKKKIESLTPEQEAQMDVYAKKWIDIGLNCDPCDFEASKKHAIRAYEMSGLEPPRKFYLFDSPWSAAIGTYLLRGPGDYLKRDKAIQGEQRKVDMIEGWSSIVDTVSKQLDANGDGWVGMSEDLREMATQAMDGEHRSGRLLPGVIRSYVTDMVYGSHEAGWLSFYDYMANCLGIELTPRIEPFFEIAKTCGWWAMYEGMVVFQHRHEEVHIKDGKLHRDGGPAIRYRDGFSMWSLNGVSVPQWLAETPTEKIKVEQINRLKNAQQRAEAISKFGIDRYVYKSGAKVIDTEEPMYQILEVPWHDGTKKRYLKMKNPSVDELWHVEGVGDEVNVIDEAIEWRLPDKFRGMKVSDDGCDWHQQGDVVFFPKGATCRKPRPTVLT